MTATDAPPQERILLVASSGGHLAQLMRLEPWWAQHATAWVTFSTKDAVGLLADEPDVTWAHHPTTRNLPNLVRNAIQALATIRRHRPTVIVSTGAGVAIPYFLLSRLLDVRTVYIEVFDRISTPTLTGRVVRPFADLMLVQWPEQEALYDGAVVVGPLL